ncbi:MAG: LytR family transcriptional regulator [Lachnospiraceae bacterium]|nr:LytR family transcriptional regulator [Lachnospiraceae bacterium]
MKSESMRGKNIAGNVALYVVEVIFLVLGIVFYFFSSKLADNVQRVSLNIQEKDMTIYAGEVVGEEDIANGQPADTDLSTQEPIVTPGEEEGITYRNIALFGVDSREGQLLAGTRSDTIMIASINEKTKEIKLISVYRDSFLNVGEDTYNKANVAYAKGGPERAIQMLNENLDLNISDYVTVGFRGLIDTVESVDGIEMEISEEEIDYLNSYQMMMAQELDLEFTPIEEPGLQLLNGMQATAYCRIRYTAGSDFMRTQRQRNVLIAVLEKAKTKSLVDINNAINAVLPSVSTSFSSAEILELASSLTLYRVVDNTGMPFQKYRANAFVSNKGSCVIPYDLEANVTELHRFLFDVQDYIPSDTVKQYNQEIRRQTEGYLEW